MGRGEPPQVVPEHICSGSVVFHLFFVLLFYTLTRVGQEALPTHGFASALHYSPEFTSVGTSRRCPSRYQVISGTGLPFRLLQVAI